MLGSNCNRNISANFIVYISTIAVGDRHVSRYIYIYNTSLQQKLESQGMKKAFAYICNPGHI